MAYEYSREDLLNFVNLYLEALTARDPDRLPLSPGCKATENGEPMNFKEGLWRTARSVVYRKAFADPVTGQAAFFGVVTEKEDGPAIFVLRLKIKYSQMAEIETLTARKGCHPLFSPETLEVRPFWDAAIPESERLPRDRLIDIADRYFEGLEQNDVSIIPFHPECNRRENGVQTTNNPPRFPRSAPAGIAPLGYIKKVRDRRYPLVDEIRGLVLGIVCFDIPGVEDEAERPPEGAVERTLATTKRSLFLYEIFKIENGLIRDIEAFMSNAPFQASLGWD